MNKTVISVLFIVLLAVSVWLLVGTSPMPTPEQDLSANTGAVQPPEPPPIPADTIVRPVAPTPSPDQSAAPPPQSGSVKTFSVDGKSFSFSPSTITVTKGDRVRITFKNTGGMHDFRIDELGVATKRIGSGQEETVEFVASTAGTFEYYCSVGNHRAMGMLIVEE